MDLSSVTLRGGEPEDQDALAALATRVRRAAVPGMPEPVHAPEEVRAWIGRQLAGERETWVAEAAGEIVGYLVLEPDWLHSLYVRPDLTGRGIGGLMLDVVKGLRPDGFGLWVAEANEPARRLYRRHGLLEVRRSPGSDSDGQGPAVEMVWLGSEPVGALRRRIDLVDDELAELLDRRAALTALVQDRKPVGGHAGRDLAREEAIVRRMARRAPLLGASRIGRVMRVVIAESLQAAEHREP